MSRPQPYRLEYGGTDPLIAKVVYEIDEMLQILFQDLASGSFPSSTGLLAETATTGTLATRTLTAGAGITITNGSGVAGNPTISTTGGSGQISAQVLDSRTGWGVHNSDGKAKGASSPGWSVYDSSGTVKTVATGLSEAQVVGYVSLRIL